MELAEYFNSSSANLAACLDKTVSGIIDKNVMLDSLFESLEIYLTSKDNQKRSRGVKLISQLIQRMPDHRLNHLEIEHLSRYLCSKLDDHYTVSTAALPGLNLLLRKQPPDDSPTQPPSHFVSKERSIEIIKTILKDVHVQSLVQSDRSIIFHMCQFVLESEGLLSQVKSDGYETDFVYGFIQAMDGEKDPRNLIVCFECIRLICNKLNLGPFVEEMFEVFACYFPIDFTPPKTDDLTVTKQMLINSLRAAFSSSAKFAKFALPLLIEKLESDGEEAQLDAIETFTQCARQTYDANDFKEHIDRLWSDFQKTVMTAKKISLEEAALEAIAALAFCISRSVQFAPLDSSAHFKVSIDVFISKAMRDCHAYLNEPDLKLVWPNVKCLQSLAASSSTANLLVNKSTIPLIIEHYKSTNLQNQKKTYLEILWQFVANSKYFDTKASEILVEKIDELVDLCIANQANRYLHSQSVNGFYQLLSFDGLIEAANLSKYNECGEFSNRFVIAKCLWHSLWLQANSELNNEENTRQRVIEIFYLLSAKDESTLNWLFDSINETMDGAVENGASKNLLVAFEIISSVAQFLHSDAANLTALGRKLVQIILNTFHNFLKKFQMSDKINPECLMRFLSCVAASVDKLSRLYDEETLDSFMQSLLAFSMHKYRDNSCGQFNTKVILKISLCFRVYAIHLKPSENTNKFMAKLNEIFVQQIIENFKPLELESSFEQKYKTNIFMQTVAFLDKKSFQNEIEQIFSELKEKLVRMAIGENENEDEERRDLVQLTAAQFYATLVNKIDRVNLIDSDLEELSSRLIDLIEDGDELNKRARALKLWVWITKALVLREHAKFEFYTNKLIGWLDDPNLGEISSQAFDIILSEQEDKCPVMTSKTSANIKFLYRQRFFNLVIAPLKQKFDSQHSINKKQKLFYMMSVINMLNYLPKNIINKHMKSMLPILLYAMNPTTNAANEQLCLSSLKSFETLINESNQNDDHYLLAYAGEILDRLLKMSVHEPSMDIRITALRCVNNMALNLSPNQLIQYQKLVCKQLERCLNDKKRLCRQLAVEARNRWFLLTTKNNDESK